MIVGGVDLGVRKAAVAIFQDGELATVASILLPDRGARAVELRTLAKWVYGYAKTCEYLFIEEPLVGRNTRVSLKIAQTAGAVMAEYGNDLGGTQTQFVDNKSWKKAVIGNGNASKEQIAIWLKSSHPSYSEQCGPDQDRRDATCIGIYGLQLVERAEALAKL